MIPVIFIAICYWACSGAVATIKAARATPAAEAAASTPHAPGMKATRVTPKPQLNPNDVTFGQWQRSLYRRWNGKLRSRLPGQHHGKRVRDLFGDVTAASIAGATVFGMGWAAGASWVGARWAQRDFRKKVEREFGSPSRRPTGGSRQRPGGPGSAAGLGPRKPSSSTTPPGRPSSPPDNDVIDAELLDDTENPTSTPSPYADAEDAVLIGQPQLLAHYPTAPNGDTVSEILNIHQLLDYARTVIDAAIDSAEQATIRANSASERADQAGNRSITAGNRAASAELVVANATAEAAHLEQTAARFGSLNMDSASLTSITAAIESANTVAETERRRVEAEANVAACAAALAAAEEQAAAVAAESARVTLAHVEAVKNMYDTVQARQMPHAEAQAATGNAAAHESLLAAN